MRWWEVYRLAAKIRRQSPSVLTRVVPMRDQLSAKIVGWEIQCVNIETSQRFIISEPVQWDVRRHDARMMEVLREWHKSPEGRSWEETAAKALELAINNKEVEK
jgi:hypothetical protein